MDQAEIKALFRRFAAPLSGYAATSSGRRELAEMMARNLWTAMIAGPEMEEETWKILKTTGKLGDDSLQPIKELYYEQMRPIVSEDELARMRLRYRIRRTNENSPGRQDA